MTRFEFMSALEQHVPPCPMRSAATLCANMRSILTLPALKRKPRSLQNWAVPEQLAKSCWRPSPCPLSPPRRPQPMPAPASAAEPSGLP